MKYKSLKVEMKNYRYYFQGDEVESYIDLINEEVTKGYSLFQILAIPNENPNTQLTLHIILEKISERTIYGQGYPF